MSQEGDIANDAHRMNLLADTLDHCSSQIGFQLADLESALQKLQQAFRDDRGHKAQKKLRDNMNEVAEFRRMLAVEIDRLRKLADQTIAFHRRDSY